MINAQPAKHAVPAMIIPPTPCSAFAFLNLVSKCQNRFILAIEVFKMANQMGHDEYVLDVAPMLYLTLSEIALFKL